MQENRSSSRRVGVFESSPALKSRGRSFSDWGREVLGVVIDVPGKNASDPESSEELPWLVVGNGGCRVFHSSAFQGSGSISARGLTFASIVFITEDLRFSQEGEAEGAGGGAKLALAKAWFSLAASVAMAESISETGRLNRGLLLCDNGEMGDTQGESDEELDTLEIEILSMRRTELRFELFLGGFGGGVEALAGSALVVGASSCTIFTILLVLNTSGTSDSEDANLAIASEGTGLRVASLVLSLRPVRAFHLWIALRSGVEVDGAIMDALGRTGILVIGGYARRLRSFSNFEAAIVGSTAIQERRNAG